jgi:hypothetical protein
LYTRPLDDEQGAGDLDAVAAYQLYAKKKTGDTAGAAWKEGKLKANETMTVKLGKFKAGERVDATLTWYRHVGYKDKNDNGPDGKDDYFQSASLADFTLTLLKDGVPVAGSDSDVDNLEHISWKLAETGNYSLDVYRFAEGGLVSEEFAVAARVLKATGESANALTAQAARGGAYDADGLLRGVDVPEPGMMSLVGAGLLITRRRRSR